MRKDADRLQKLAHVIFASRDPVDIPLQFEKPEYAVFRNDDSDHPFRFWVPFFLIRQVLGRLQRFMFPYRICRDLVRTCHSRTSSRDAENNPHGSTPNAANNRDWYTALLCQKSKCGRCLTKSGGQPGGRVWRLPPIIALSDGESTTVVDQLRVGRYPLLVPLAPTRGEGIFSSASALRTEILTTSENHV